MKRNKIDVMTLNVNGSVTKGSLLEVKGDGDRIDIILKTPLDPNGEDAQTILVDARKLLRAVHHLVEQLDEQAEAMTPKPILIAVPKSKYMN